MAKSTQKPSPKTRFSVGVIRLIRVAAALLSVAIIGIAALGIWFMVERWTVRSTQDPNPLT